MTAVSRTNAGIFDVASYFCSDLARSFGRLAFRRIRRSREKVAAEYDAGRWADILIQKPWCTAANLQEFLIGSDERPRLCRFEDRVLKLAGHEYYRRRHLAFGQLLSTQAGDTAEVLELGSGFGYNLFSLALSTKFKRLEGLELSPNGLAAANEIATHFGLHDRLSFAAIDLTDSGHSGFDFLAGRTCFTYFCIEQIPWAVEEVLENILAARPRRVIHVEPTTEFLQLWRPLDLLNYAYIRSVDYQTRLFSVLEKLQGQGRVKLLSRGRMHFSPSLHNYGFFATWEPS